MAIHIRNNLMEIAEQELEEYQWGFRQGRNAVHQIFVSKELQAESQEYRRPTMLLFAEFKQAYDGIRREELYTALEQMGSHNKLVIMIKLTLTGAEGVVKLNNRTTQKFRINR